jgi:ubiquinone/menaquinone biosynthesis C-methylase UbiE
LKEQPEHIKRIVQPQFGAYADKYITSKTHSKGADLILLPKWLLLGPDAVVLDIATGGGHVAKTLAPHVSCVFATDLTYEMLNNTRLHLDQSESNIFYVIADAEALPFLDNTFDAAVCRIAPHHFPHPGTFVKEAARVLKPGGKFLLIDNIAPEEKELDEFVNRLEKLRDPSHVRSNSIIEWTAWFQEASLTIVKEEHRKKKFDYPEWVRRTASSESQIKEVDYHLLTARQEIKEYFSIHSSESMVYSFVIDEWMVLVEKSK